MYKKRPTARTVSQDEKSQLVSQTKKQNIRYNVMDFSISLYQKQKKNTTK